MSIKIIPEDQAKLEELKSLFSKAREVMLSLSTRTCSELNNSTSRIYSPDYCVSTGLSSVVEFMEDVRVYQSSMTLNDALEYMQQGDEDQAWAVAQLDTGLDKNTTKETWLEFAKDTLKRRGLKISSAAR